MNGVWQEIYIGDVLFCNNYFSSKQAMNIIVSHTPVFSTTLIKQVYEPLADYDVNIFAFDFSGTGKSKGKAKDFSTASVLSDFGMITSYISANFSDDIHIFGNTGTGGIFAQYYVCSGAKVKSFAQFACAIHKDTKPLGYPYPLVKLICHIMKAFPDRTITFREPEYSGPHAERDDGVYREIERICPDFRKCKMSLVTALAESLVSDKSELANRAGCPTLVFKTLHDRYFPADYFDRYYDALSCEKKLVEVDDVHNSYYLSSRLFCREAYNWFALHR